MNRRQAARDRGSGKAGPGGRSAVHFARIPALWLALLLAFLGATPKARGQWLSSPAATEAGALQAGADSQAEAELEEGIALTRQSRFQEAIPHFLAARGRVRNEYAADFNLALCYVATSQFPQAVQILNRLAKGRPGDAGVYNLLAQALIGEDATPAAFQAFQQAARLEPKNEQLYLLVAEACMDHQSYHLGLSVLDTGLQNLPQSPRLYYQRGVFYSFLDEPVRAGNDLQHVAQLAPESVLAYLAVAQKALLNGDNPGAIRAARTGLDKAPHDFFLLSILGQALLRNGVSPGQPEFAEAQAALEKSVAERPDYWVSQLALGKIEVKAGHLEEAIAHLEIARRLSPSSPAAYSQLALAYRKQGNMEEAEKMLAVLAQLNQQEEARYKLAEPGHMASYLGSQEPH